MTPIAVILGGFFAGFASGAYAGADLSVAAAALASGRARLRVAYGLGRRLAVFAAVLLLSLALGPWAWTGVAAGHLLGFGLGIRRAVRA